MSLIPLCPATRVMGKDQIFCEGAALPYVGTGFIPGPIMNATWYEYLGRKTSGYFVANLRKQKKGAPSISRPIIP
jgi:hypothetical protein